MSRIINEAVSVACDESGFPVSFVWQGRRCFARDAGERFREWIGALQGEPERDIWRLDTQQGICELHFLHPPIMDGDALDGDWLLYRWED